MRRFAWLGVAVVLLALWAWQQRPHAPTPVDAGRGVSGQAQSGQAQPAPRSSAHDQASRWPGFLPSQALDTLHRIEREGPFDHRQDGSTFQNRERLLPSQPRGYYREYTVATPGSRDRGARRIVSGGDPPSEFFYTEDHYRSFRRFVPVPQSSDAMETDQ